jgi:hypothetical protein
MVLVFSKRQLCINNASHVCVKIGMLVARGSQP